MQRTASKLLTLYNVFGTHTRDLYGTFCSLLNANLTIFGGVTAKNNLTSFTMLTLTFQPPKCNGTIEGPLLNIFWNRARHSMTPLKAVPPWVYLESGNNGKNYLS